MSSQKRPRSPAPSGPTAYAKSKSITDRASTFTAVFSPTISARQLQAFPEFRSASHRIAAWRTPSKQTTLPVAASASAGAKPRGIYDAGHDDDGEQWAGKRLERILEEQNVTGNVVVARWYGGVMLGPARFRWIEETAREAVQRWRKGERGDAPGQTDAKRQKTDEHEEQTEQRQQPQQPQQTKNAEPTPAARALEYRDKEELIAELKQRDESIAVLRKFLAEKRAKLEPSLDESSPKPASQPSPSKVPNYSTIPLEKLKLLERGRDATLSHLLKDLDRVDQQLAEEAELDAAFAAVAEKEERKEAVQNEEEAWEEMERIMAEEEAAKLKKVDDTEQKT